MNPISNKQTGFTLVELLVVMLILVAMASVTIETTSELAFQNRYEVTKDRYEKIKRAIIGRPDVLINGQPDISGFVADVGRLPFALQELLEEGFCSDTTLFDPATCVGGPPLWTANGYGWNGPYISSTKDPSENTALADGWGNNSQGNYGWSVSYVDITNTPTVLIADAIAMNIQSLGIDNSAGGTGYDADYPLAGSLPSIRYNDWTVDTSTLQIAVSTPSNGECANAVCSDPTYGVYADCIQPRSTWRVGVCSVDPSINTTAVSCSGASGVWAVLPGCSINPLVNTTSVLCATAGGTWTVGVCSNPIYPDQSSCEQARASWLGCSVSPTTNITKTDCDTTPGTWDSAIENNCKTGGGLWVTRQPNIQLKLNGTLSSSTPQITEDGYNHIMSFTFAASRIPVGDVSIGVYYSTDTDLTYPGLCTDSNNHANFTQANCTTNSGTWFYDGTEKSCSSLTVALDCTGTTSPQLGGTLTEEITLTLSPHTTPPVINW